MMTLGLHEPFVLGGQLGIGLAGMIGGGEERFPQQRIAGLGQSGLLMGLPGLVELGNQPGVGADGS